MSERGRLARKPDAADVDFTVPIGVLAALATTASYFPQLKKCWETGEANDLSLTMFLILTVGIGLWIVYGAMRSDWVIIIANSISLCALLGILYFKLRTGARIR